MNQRIESLDAKQMEMKWKKENESGDSKETKHKLITINNHTLETNIKYIR